MKVIIFSFMVWVVPMVAVLAAREGEWRAGVETLSTDDISIRAVETSFEMGQGDWVYQIGVGNVSYGLDYVNPLFASSARLEDDTWRADLSVSRKWQEEWIGTVKVGGYDGFAEYRSLWLSEFYRESWSGFPSYHAPQPQGASATTTLLWNYLPGSGSAEAGVHLGHDRVAPAWAFNPALGQPEPSREKLSTLAGFIRFEQALNGWLKTGGDVSLAETTEREQRLSLNHSWAATVGDFAFRISAGYSEERPAFRAVYGGISGEWNFASNWTLQAGHRLYHDTGEIASSSFTAAAPELDSQETHLGLLWERGAWAASAGLAYLQSDYAPLSPANSFFGDLYRDRDWVSIRAAISFSY